ncbi:hypothetical protein GQ53DRAFT_449493 [Thozetella sp. PMI_491]|nr:hypothetical protein GQ53DRAFT_449493 [Thozetella sp. PMI_491]
MAEAASSTFRRGKARWFPLTGSPHIQKGQSSAGSAEREQRVSFCGSGLRVWPCAGIWPGIAIACVGADRRIPRLGVVKWQRWSMQRDVAPARSCMETECDTRAVGKAQS